MHREVLTAKAHRLLPSLVKLAAHHGFYLAGGTALALQYGHRRSVDFDFFSSQDFNTQKLRQACLKLGEFTVTSEARGTLHGTLAGVRLTFLYYPYRLLGCLLAYNSLKLADPRDIACMKLQAVANRGSKKDFFDLYELLRHYTLEDILTWFETKYGRKAYSRLHLLKSLIYFADADNEPLPRLLIGPSWSKVKIFMRQQVKKLL